MYADLLLFIDRRNHSANWQQILQKSIDRYKSKNIIVSKNPEKSIKFYTPSLLASYRAKTIFTKEPDTIDWLNKNGSRDNCLFDIGANLGLYSIYYAKKFDAKVFSFEPSFKNLELFARNISLNALQEKSSPGHEDLSVFFDNFIANQSALNRLPTINEVAEMVFFLASQNASAITGQCINVDCGVLPQ